MLRWVRSWVEHSNQSLLDMKRQMRVISFEAARKALIPPLDLERFDELIEEELVKHVQQLPEVESLVFILLLLLFLSSVFCAYFFPFFFFSVLGSMIVLLFLSFLLFTLDGKLLLNDISILLHLDGCGINCHVIILRRKRRRNHLWLENPHDREKVVPDLHRLKQSRPSIPIKMVLEILLQILIHQRTGRPL